MALGAEHALPLEPTAVLRLCVEYDGEAFHGWAPQPGQRTVGGVLQEALEVYLRRPLCLSVAGRTDAGVHATGQVVTVPLNAAIVPGRLLKAMAALLPPDVAVRDAELCADVGFDARRSALWRRYEYRLLVGRPSPLRRSRCLHRRDPLDAAAMDRCADATVGQHDFRAFTPRQTDHVFFDRTVRVCRWERRADELVLVIEANAYLRGMVRVLAGSMLEVGRGRRGVAWFVGLLEGADRSEAGPTLPAHALTLVGVGYPGDDPDVMASR